MEIFKKDKGFTLIEMMVVISIIAVLSLLIVAAIRSARENAINTQRVANAKTLEAAVIAYASANHGRFPTKCSTCNVTTSEVQYPTIGLQQFLINAGYLKTPLSGLDQNIRYNGTTSGDHYVLTVCDAKTTTWDNSLMNSSYLVPGTPDEIGASFSDSICVNPGVTLYSSAK